MTTDKNDIAMPTDADLELLESHLDGELGPVASDALQARLVAEPELSIVLNELRAARALRRAAFATLEPGAVAIDRFAWRIRGAVTAELNRPIVPAEVNARPSRWGSFRPDPWRIARVGAAAAACIVLGFFGGRIGRGPLPGVTVVASPSSVVAPVGAPRSAIASAGVDMPITDEYGRVVDHQHFDSPEQARRFSDDLRRTQDGPAPSPVEGPTRLASELRY